MFQRFGHIMMLIGAVVFIGNITDLFETIPFLGMTMAGVGYLLTRLGSDYDASMHSKEDW